MQALGLGKGPCVRPLRIAGCARLPGVIVQRRRVHAHAKGGASKKGTPAPPPPEEFDDDEQLDQGDEDDFGEDGFLEDDEFEDEDAEDVVAALGLGEDDQAPGIFPGATNWGEAGLKAARKVLSAPAMEGIDLYLFRAITASKKLDIRLDKLSDLYGSPSLDDIERFSRMMFLEMEALLGAEEAGDVSFEVSSPGAERQLQLPGDLNRFQEMPLKVEYTTDTGAAATQILDLVAFDEDAGNTEWRLADVRANAPVKGRRLSKKQKEMRLAIPVDKLTRVRIHVDF